MWQKIFVALLVGCFSVVSTPCTAHAAVWGGFDVTRVNYAGGTLDGSAHDSLRALIVANGDSVTAMTSTLTPAYLSGIDIFYTSLARVGGPVLSAAEQAALQAWIASGGTLIVSGDVFNLPFYESFTSFYGVTGYTDLGLAGGATSTVYPHPLTAP